MERGPHPMSTEGRARARAHRERLNARSDRVAAVLGCDPEAVAIEPPQYVCLTVDQVDRLLAMIPKDDQRGLTE